jgi:CRISPR type III-B/RAMP module RAMP protein Cmr1
MIKTLRVNLIMPAIIGGANSRKLDTPLLLRPPAVRGMLRFWTRALAGGAGMSEAQMREIEGKLWGDTRYGQGIRILAPTSVFTKSAKMFLFPHKSTEQKKSKTDMIQPDQEAVLRFGIPPHVLDEMNKIKAVVWTWLHLGSIGKRARRGYGSLLWMKEADDLLEGFVDFKLERDFASETALANYLKRGLAKVKSAWGAPIASASRSTYDFYKLATIDQVFVGSQLREGRIILDAVTDNRGGVLELIHGSRASGRGKELGNSSPRLASPMMWRLFKLNTGGYVPVLTWSPREMSSLPAGSAIYGYLNGKLGFGNSLDGNPLYRQKSSNQ